MKLCKDSKGMVLLVLCLMLGVFLTACSAPNTATPSVPASMGQEASWSVQFSMSGGFAGLQRSVELSSTGQMTVIDRKEGRQVTVQIPEAEMEAISSWVLQAQPVPPPARLPACRDCFEYEVTIHRGGEALSFWYDDATLEGAELAPLINTLARLQDQALSGQLAP